MKPIKFVLISGQTGVAPFTGAWIETRALVVAIAATFCRPLHGGVD